jgi:acetoin utilization deacetylase AcuC-like enzyme
LLDEVEPDMVFYQCGVDILETDKLGRLGVSSEGCAARDRRILERCYADEVPVVCSMGGGYSPDIWHIVEAHCNTFRIAHELWG